MGPESAPHVICITSCFWHHVLHGAHRHHLAQAACGIGAEASACTVQGAWGQSRVHAACGSCARLALHTASRAGLDQALRLAQHARSSVQGRSGSILHRAGASTCCMQPTGPLQDMPTCNSRTEPACKLCGGLVWPTDCACTTHPAHRAG